MTAAAIRKLEAEETERLRLINEAAARPFFAEKLGNEMSDKFSDLIGMKDSPDELVLKAN